jgi:hypothetical protein
VAAIELLPGVVRGRLGVNDQTVEVEDQGAEHSGRLQVGTAGAPVRDGCVTPRLTGI